MNDTNLIEFIQGYIMRNTMKYNSLPKAFIDDCFPKDPVYMQMYQHAPNRHWYVFYNGVWNEIEVKLNPVI